MIKKATFVSVWDDGYEVTSDCTVDTDTNEVLDIDIVYVDELDVEILTSLNKADYISAFSFRHLIV